MIRQDTYVMDAKCLMDTLETGDLILMAGLYRQHLIQKSYTGCGWAHVGIVFCAPSPRGAANSCLFESTMTATCADFRTGAMHEGVQLTSIATRIASFKGEVAIRKLRPSLSAAESGELVAAALQYAGVLQAPPGGRFASNYIPADFASDFEKAELPMVRPFKYLREVTIRSIELTSEKGSP